ncbi:hypothetical protein GCM10027203_63120 [Nonomuraea fastidiosa]
MSLVAMSYLQWGTASRDIFPERADISRRSLRDLVFMIGRPGRPGPDPHIRRLWEMSDMSPIRTDVLLITVPLVRL